MNHIDPIERKQFVDDALAARWTLIPLPPRSKGTHIRNWSNVTIDQSIAAQDNLSDPELCNVGIITGYHSNIVAIDLDPKERTAEEMLADLNDAFGPLPQTRTHRTRSGGLHLIFERPATNMRILNSNKGIHPFVKNVDVRADHGYIVAPTSYVEDEKGAGVYSIVDASEPAVMPERLAEALVYKEWGSDTSEASTGAVEEIRCRDYNAARLLVTSKWAEVKTFGTGGSKAYYGMWAAARFEAGLMRVTHPNMSEDDLFNHVKRIAEKFIPWDSLNDDDLKHIRNGVRAGMRSPFIIERVDEGLLATEVSEDEMEKRIAQKVREIQIAREAKLRADTSESEKKFTGIKTFTLDDLDTLPPRTWRVHDCIPLSTTNMLFGAPASYKSFVALDLALSIASGVPAFGKFETLPGKALYVLDEGFQGFGDRIKAWCATRGVNARDISDRFVVTSSGILLTDPYQVNYLADMVEDGEFDFIVFDTLAKMSAGANEDLVMEMQPILNAIDGVRKRHDGASVLIVHHANKSGEYRGSSSMHGHMDVMLSTKVLGANAVSLQKYKDKEGESGVELAALYAKSVDEFNSLAITANLTDVVANYGVENKENDTRRITPARRAFEGIMKTFPAEGIKRQGVVKLLMDAGASYSTAQRHIKEAINEGLIVQEGEYLKVNSDGGF